MKWKYASTSLSALFFGVFYSYDNNDDNDNDNDDNDDDSNNRSFIDLYS